MVALTHCCCFFGTAGRKNAKGICIYIYIYINTGEKARDFHGPTYIRYLQNSDFDTSFFQVQWSYHSC